jgi:2,3-dihydroxybiphenyl 1,2-dioxygenase
VYRHLELAYLGIQVPEPSLLSSFFGEVIGLVPGDDIARDQLTWRDDRKVHRLIVEAGDANDATFVGFEAVDDAAFEELAGRIRAAGIDVVDGDAAGCRARRVDRLISTMAPWGVRVEVVIGLADAATEYDSSLMTGGFHTDGVGFGHVVFATTAFDQSHQFAIDILGLQQTDWLAMDLGGGIVLEVRFYHCNERHHTLALARAPFDLPQTLHHVMFETNDRDDVGAAFDRAWASGLPIPNGLGRHDNDGMFSFYVGSPAGFQVEVGHGAKTVSADWNDNRAYDQISAWGHQPLRQA